MKLTRASSKQDYEFIHCVPSPSLDYCARVDFVLNTEYAKSLRWHLWALTHNLFMFLCVYVCVFLHSQPAYFSFETTGVNLKSTPPKNLCINLHPELAPQGFSCRNNVTAWQTRKLNLRKSWSTPIMPSLIQQMEAEGRSEFQTNLDYDVKTCLKTEQRNSAKVRKPPILVKTKGLTKTSSLAASPPFSSSLWIPLCCESPGRFPLLWAA